MSEKHDEKRFARIQRRVTAEQDGTREGGLVICIALIGGMVLAAMAHPAALASFWVWVGLLCMAIGCGVSVKRWIGGAPDKDEVDA